MNRLLQHFVDSGGAQGASPARPPIAAPPQSSGGSYNAGNRGSYQRAAPGGPFYYQPPAHPQWPPQQLNEGHNGGHNGLQEISLTSQSTGAMYETVDLNADSSQQHRPPQPQHQPQRLFTPSSAGHRPPSTPNSQGHNYGYKAPTPPSSHVYQQKPPGSTGSASELFANGPPAGPSSGGGNPFRKQSTPVNDPFAASPSGNEAVFGQKVPFTQTNGGEMLGNNTSPVTDPFAAAPTQNGVMFGQPSQNDPFGTAQENRNVFGNGTSAQDPFPAQPPKNAGFNQQKPAAPAGDPFGFTPSHSGSSPFESPAPSNNTNQSIASADSLFASPAPTNAGDWAHSSPPQPSQPPAKTNTGDWSHPPLPLPSQPPAPSNTGEWSHSPPPQPSQPPAQAHELFANDASSLFGDTTPSPFQIGQSTAPNISPSPPKPQDNIPPPPPGKPQATAPANRQTNVPPSPAKSQTSVPPSPMKYPETGSPTPQNNASSPPMKPQVSAPASPAMRPEDHLTPAFGSMRLSISKSPMKSGLDVRHMKFPAGKREDDAMSNAPSIAPSRMSMLSTLDDSLKLSDMYKQMTSRLEGEKHDLLKVVSVQAQEISQLKKHIKSLELQLKKCQAHDA
ncbi:hypothetical protein P3T76_006893 [Phytophthora citrophthora]|uniref:Uncharacterized protein n=1 Tax=Phytophthora citrophthora TaxID=4793 RepID=A0AAD9LP82_9STRA|nr:hypothetical protein P3T76_006893 [Phytophthora citrophthora]